MSRSTTVAASATSSSTSTQDTNHAQYVLIRELTGDDENADPPPAELCVVGDADQSIYAFRGATIRNIEEFERDFPNAQAILLEQNYRSTQTILSAANAVIAQNPNRRAKRLWTDSGDGELIVGYVADTDRDEATFIAGEIDGLTDYSIGGSASRASTRYRRLLPHQHRLARAVEEVFVRHGIPYKVVGGTKFYERKEVRDIVAYPRTVANPDDTGEPAAHLEHASARYRRPRGGMRRGARREPWDQLHQALVEATGNGSAAEHARGQPDQRVRRPYRGASAGVPGSVRVRRGRRPDRRRRNGGGRRRR